MGVFKSIVSKLGAAEEKTTVRVRGLFKWSRRLTVYSPGSTGPIVWSLALAEASSVNFEITESADGRFVARCCGDEVCTVASKEQALELMEAIGQALAPSKWRYVRRLLVVWFIGWIFFGSMPQRQPMQQQASAQGPGGQLYVAPQRAAQALPPAAPAAPVNRPIASGDPFGLQITEEK